MLVNLNVTFQQALNEVSHLVKKQQATIYRGTLPTLDVPFRDTLNMFKEALSLILLSSDSRQARGGVIRIDALREVDEGRWAITISTDLNSHRLPEERFSSLRSLAKQSGASLEISSNIKNSIFRFHFPYNKV